MGLIYQKRRLKVNKIKRQIASCRANLGRLRLLLSFILIVLICFGSYKALKLPQWYLDNEKLMKCDEDIIKIQGNVITPKYKIENMIRQTQFDNVQIFRLNTKELEDNISQLQSVKKVYVRRYWFPARLTIAIDERVPAFLLAPNLESDPTCAITIDGVLIDHEYLPFNSSVKAKKLLTYGVRNGHEEIWEKKRVDEILKLVKAIETYSNQSVQYIDLRNEKDVYIMLEEYLIRFGEINDTSLNRAKWIASILPEAKKIDQKIKYIDLRWEDSRYFRLEGAKEEKAEIPQTDEAQQDNKQEEQQETQKQQPEAQAENQPQAGEEILH